MNLRQISAIARPVDRRFPTNRAIACGTVVLMVGDFLRRLLTGSDLLASAWAAAGLGLTVFLAWALCREIDPDRDFSAFVAAGVALVGKLLWGLPHLAMIFWLLLAVRIVNRTTGLRSTAVDSLAVLALATWLSFRVWWPVGGLTALAFIMDGWLGQPHVRHRILGFLMLAVTLGAASLAEPALRPRGPTWASGTIAVVLCLVFVPVVVAARDLTTLSDDTNERLATTRVRAAQLLVMTAGVAAVCWIGAAGLIALWPIWSAVIGASAYLLVKSALA
jgi:hypothetical protein